MQITAKDEQELNILVQQYVAQGFHVESNISGNVILKKKGYNTGVLVILLFLGIIFGLIYYILSKEQIITITTNAHNNYNNNFNTNQNTEINNNEIEMYCVKCGSPIFKDSKFCTGCGNPVKTSEESTNNSSEIKEIVESNEEDEIKDNNTKEIIEPEVIKNNDKSE